MATRFLNVNGVLGESGVFRVGCVEHGQRGILRNEE
jgi:hypothetical protein